MTVANELQFRGTDRFEVISYLGGGGMGLVYKVFDRETGSFCALKTLRIRNPEALLRFKNEFRALQGLQHPNLIALGELGEADGTWYFTMELVEGVDFLAHVAPTARRVATAETDRDIDGVSTSITPPPIDDPERVAARSSGELPLVLAPPKFDEVRLRDALIQLVRGLSALHEAQKVHRDVKPTNILVAADARVVLLDFGLVLDVDDVEAVTEDRVVGTTAYMAPEQIRAQAPTPAADWYAVGVLIYEALTGVVPFTGAPLEILMRKQGEVPAPPGRRTADVPPDLEALCMDLLQADPARRPGAKDILKRLGVTEARPSRRLTIDPPDAPAGSFIGRQRELSSLLEGLRPPRQGRTIAIRGPSGVGKSALIRRFAECATEAHRDLVVLSGRCYERETVPFKAVDGVIDALSRYMRKASRAEAAALLPDNAGLLAQVFPVLRRVEAFGDTPLPRGAVVDPHESRRRAFAALRELLARIAVRRPLVVAIDDMQWADTDSLALLGDVMQPPGQPPLVLVLAMRASPNAETEEDIVAKITGEVRRVDLYPLPQSDARKLAADLLRRVGEPSPGEVEALAREAAGHPFFIQALVQHVASAGIGAAQMTRLDDALRARFARLEPSVRRVLELVAAAGVPLAQEVIAAAAELDFADYGRCASELRGLHLVRTTGARRSDTVEPYHERIRDAALQTLTDQEKQRLHRQLADALEVTGAAEQAPQLVLHHLAAAGLSARAAYHAEVAAERAAKTFAFDRAAALYRLAVRLGSYDQKEQHRLSLALAEALVNGGRGAEAAQIYLAAADTADPSERLDFLRRAAEQLLISGNMERGLEVVRQVLQHVGGELPVTPQRALASLLWQRLRLRLRGMRWKRRAESEIAPRELTRLEIYKAIAMGLSIVDNVRGADFQCRHLQLALKLGEPRRLIRALSFETWFLAAQGLARRSKHTVDEVARLAREHDDATSRVYATLAAAAVAYFIDNAWRAGFEELTGAQDGLQAHFQVGGWEADTARLYACFNLLYLGELGELGRRAASYVRDADQRGDRYASVNLRTRLAIAKLAADDARGAEHDVEDALRSWMPRDRSFQVQHFFALYSQCEIALYAGDARRAASTMARDYPALKRSLLLRIPLVWAEIEQLRARIALAQAAASSSQADRRLLLDEVRAYARRLERCSVRLARVWAPLVRAGAASVEGARDEAAAQLRAAVTAFDGLETMLYRHAAARRLGAMIGGTEGEQLVAGADAWMTARSVANIEAMTRTLAPGWK
jgi:serine/threonine protein kinase